MTTDTAVRVTRIVVQDKSEKKTTGFVLCLLTLGVTAVSLEDIPYTDYPEIKINKHESTEMPFRYVKDKEGQAVMPEVSELLPDIRPLYC